jgi:hypothetical protein
MSSILETSGIAREIVRFLNTEAERPMQLCEIAPKVHAKDRGHCSRLLKQLVGEGKIAIHDDSTYSHYWRTGEPATSSTHPPTLWNESTTLSTHPPTLWNEPPTLWTHSIDSLAHSIDRLVKIIEISHTCSCTCSCKHLISTQLNQSRKKKIQKTSRTQAEVSTPSETAEQAVAESIPCPVAAGSLLPSETTPVVGNDAEVSGKEKRVFRSGLIFRNENDPTSALYRMLEVMQNKMTVDPDSVSGNILPEISMHEAFAKHIERGSNYARKKGIYLRDYVLHRMAFFLTYNEDYNLSDEYKIETMIEHAITDNKKSPWNPLLDNLATKFRYREWGWHGGLLSDEDTWDAELRFAEKHGTKLRAKLFPSRHRKLWSAKKRVTETLTQPDTDKPTQPERQVRVDTGQNPILTAVAEKIGQRRFDLWIGDETECVVEGNKVTLHVRNNFHAQSIKRYCKNDIEEALTTLNPDYICDVIAKPPVLTH